LREKKMGKRKNDNGMLSRDHRHKKKNALAKPKPKNHQKNEPEKHSNSSSTIQSEKWSKSKKKKMRRILASSNNIEHTGDVFPAQSPPDTPKHDSTKGNNVRIHSEVKVCKEQVYEVEQIKPDTNSDVIDSKRSDICSDEVAFFSVSKQKRSALQESFIQRLSGSRFRELNEVSFFQNISILMFCR